MEWAERTNVTYWCQCLLWRHSISSPACHTGCIPLSAEELGPLIRPVKRGAAVVGVTMSILQMGNLRL